MKVRIGKWPIVMGDDFLDAGVEFIAVDHDDVPASEAHDFDIRADPDDLETFASLETRVGFFHLHLIVELVIDYHGSSSIFTAAGTLGRPGIVMIAPVKGTTKLAPAERLTSRMVMVNPVGAPKTLGSSVRDCGVFAMQI